MTTTALRRAWAEWCAFAGELDLTDAMRAAAVFRDAATAGALRQGWLAPLASCSAHAAARSSVMIASRTVPGPVSAAAGDQKRNFRRPHPSPTDAHSRKSATALPSR